jgi:hypothetical protein
MQLNVYLLFVNQFHTALITSKCTLDRQQGCQKIKADSTALTLYNLKVFHEEKTLTQFLTHYSDNTRGTGGVITLT